MKKKLVVWFVDYTEGWNYEFHEAIEKKVLAEFKKCYPENISDTAVKEKTISNMRSFYYSRMTNTAMLLIAASSVLFSIIAIAIALIK